MAADGATVLVVDDEPLNVDLVEQELGAAGYKTVSAASGEQAVIVAAKSRPDLILLDVMMPGMDGYAVCQSLKQSEATRDIPVVFLTALTDTFEKVRAFKLGAVDYVTKPFQPEELLARVGTHIALRREIEAHRKSRATIQRLVDEMRHDMVGDSPAARRLREQIAQVAPTDSTVLIQGETGTGKELVARAIHEASRRRERALVTVNCAALPRELVESELFGHEKGAFTGATQQRRGRFELADGGTLFLDEVGELPLEAQAKLLRVLQSGEFDRVGGTRALHADVRVIAATNRDLQAQVTAGRFRSDLYYRLNVFPITVPPLRERRGDIPGLAQHFAAKASRKLGKPLRDLSGTFLERAGAYDWPGNIRELENMVERALILADGELLFPAAAPAAGDAESLEDVERSHIRSVLERTRWVIEGDKGAARILGLNPSTLRGRLRKLGIRKTS
ncbi:MAG: sigma-54-dependent Fis family transcriptional regulator [Betaproteobacteria bacterium]|nr:MAG: sigma-54-dependent Fis family transcriptional regulator [Betaproteobacteria bacterium]